MAVGKKKKGKKLTRNRRKTNKTNLFEFAAKNKERKKLVKSLCC